MAQHCTVSWLSQHIWCAAFALEVFGPSSSGFSKLNLNSGANPLPLSFVTEKSARKWCYKRCVSLWYSKITKQMSQRCKMWKKSHGSAESMAAMAPARKMPRRPSNPGLRSTNWRNPKWWPKTEAARYPEILTKILLKPKFWFECLPLYIGFIQILNRCSTCSQTKLSCF